MLDFESELELEYVVDIDFVLDTFDEVDVEDVLDKEGLSKDVLDEDELDEEVLDTEDVLSMEVLEIEDGVTSPVPLVCRPRANIPPPFHNPPQIPSPGEIVATKFPVKSEVCEYVTSVNAKPLTRSKIVMYEPATDALGKLLDGWK